MVIARFSYLVAAASLAFIGFVLFVFAETCLRHATDIRFWLLFAILPIVLLYTWELLRQLIFHGGRAAWIANGKLIFLPYGWPDSYKAFLVSISLSEIDHFSSERIETGSFVNWLGGIRVHWKSGGYSQIPAYFFSEPRDVVLARLNGALAAQR